MPHRPSDSLEVELHRGAVAIDTHVRRQLRTLAGAQNLVAVDNMLGALVDDPAKDLERSLVRLRLLTSIIGVEDVGREIANDTEPTARFIATNQHGEVLGLGVRVGKHTDPVQPFVEALQAFSAKGVVSRATFDAMAKAAQQDAFFMTHLASVRSVGVMKKALLAAIAEGLSVRSFLKALRGQLATHGFLVSEAVRKAPVGARRAVRSLGGTYLSTVYRNAAMRAYNEGRVRMMSAPEVLLARPYWQVRAVDDERTRPTHKHVNKWVMLASDPGWQATTPPFGHNCRCRLVARSAEWVQSASVTVWSGALPSLPDPGWTTLVAAAA